MGADWGDAKGTVGVTPPGGQADYGDDGDTWGGRGVGISTSGENGLHYEAAGNHIGKVGMLSNL